MKPVTDYSIWLEPTGIVRAKLTCIISQLSDEFKAPKFPYPHVTLFQGLAGNKLDLISKNFKNLVILIKNINELRSVHLKARKIFCSGKIHPPFHLTLLWKEISKKQRKQIIAKIEKKFNLKFEAKTIYLVIIGNKPEKWIPIKRFYLKK